MRAIVIGATGHIGTYLIPRLVNHGYNVTAISRGIRQPYSARGEWNVVEHVKLDRDEEEKSGTFAEKIAAMNPDVVVDLQNYSVNSTKTIVEALKGTNISHYVFCSSIWEHGWGVTLPMTEDMPRRPICDYGKDKLASVEFLHSEYVKIGFPYSSVMPGHITGPGWTCINPCGNFDPLVFEDIAKGKEIFLPNFGMEAVHHVHADDVAQLFFKSIIRRSAALDQNFLAVAPAAMSLRGFAELMYSYFGHEPKITYLPWEDWKKTARSEAYINSTYAHLMHNDIYSAEKARRLLGYEPRYNTMQAVCECVESMVARGVIGF